MIDGFSKLVGGVAILVLCAHSVFEARFTVSWRIVVRTRHPGLGDLAYSSGLVYKRLVHWLVGSRLPGPAARRKALGSPYLRLITSLGRLSAVRFGNRRFH